jgi:ubiquinone/menaquinone biosynthesis C-methylase UbiE
MVLRVDARDDRRDAEGGRGGAGAPARAVARRALRRAGNGLNFAHYPPAVERLVAVEPEPLLREAAREAAGRAPVPVEVVEGVAERLPADDASFDAGATCRSAR